MANGVITGGTREPSSSAMTKGPGFLTLYDNRPLQPGVTELKYGAMSLMNSSRGSICSAKKPFATIHM